MLYHIVSMLNLPNDYKLWNSYSYKDDPSAEERNVQIEQNTCTLEFVMFPKFSMLLHEEPTKHRFCICSEDELKIN